MITETCNNEFCQLPAATAAAMQANMVAPDGFTYVYNPEGVAFFEQFNLVWTDENGVEHDIFEVTPITKSKQLTDKHARKADPYADPNTDERKARIAFLSEFYAKQEVIENEMSYYSSVKAN